MFEVSLRLSAESIFVTKVKSAMKRLDAEALVKAASELAMQLTYPTCSPPAHTMMKGNEADRFCPNDWDSRLLCETLARTSTMRIIMKCMSCAALPRSILAKKECEEAIKIDPANCRHRPTSDT